MQHVRWSVAHSAPSPLHGLLGMRESFAADALVKDIRPAVFSALLTYLYTDTLQLERPEDIMELLVVANQVGANAGSLLWFIGGLLEIRPSQPPVH